MCAAGAWSVLRALSALSVLSCAASALNAASALDTSSASSVLSEASTASRSYCRELQQKLEASRGPTDRFVRSGGVARRVALGGGGGAAAAAHALLAAVLRHGLRYSRDDIQLRFNDTNALCALVKQSGLEQDYMVNVASAWRKGEWCPFEADALTRCMEKAHLGMVGEDLLFMGPGAAPAARRLLARLAAGAARADCSSWPQLARPECLFLPPRARPLPGEQKLPSNWTNCTCTSADICIDVLVAQEAGEASEASEATRALVHELCGRARGLRAGPALRLVPLPDAALRHALRHHNQSFLFVDYDLWGNGSADERVWPAPALPCTGAHAACEPLDSAVSLFVAEAGRLKEVAPRVFDVLAHYRPSAAILRRVLWNVSELGLEEAACEAAGHIPEEVSSWMECRGYDYVNLTVRTCASENISESNNIIKAIVLKHFGNRTTRINLDFAKVIECTDVITPNDDLRNEARAAWAFPQMAGLVVMGAAGAGPLPASAAETGVPLLLGEPPGRGPPTFGECAVSPGAAQLAAALRRLLARCSWRRVALLREEGRTGVWEQLSSSGGSEALVMHEQILGTGGPGPALAALRGRDARVVVVDAGAAAARRVLREAAARAMTPAAGYAWLVLRAAGERRDWVPAPGAGFSYVTLSGWWRGNATLVDGEPAALAGRRELREQLDSALGSRWPPPTAPLVDALLLMMTGIDDLLKDKPQFRYDLHAPDYRRLLLQRLKNTTVAGVSHSVSCGTPPLVFVHQWSEGRGRLLAAWGASVAGAELDAPALCGAVRDAAPCRTTSSGDAFTPTCHDVAFIVVLCALVLAPPALCAAASARRARLRRRDRAVEERLLARDGRSAAAAAALAEHCVPRAALELMDELGVGHYGSVRLAVLRAPDSAPLAVAAKTPRADAAADAEIELLREAALLATLKHDHVVRFAGVCFEGAPLVLMEHAFHGDLRRYLRARRPALERARAGEAEPEAAHVDAAALTRLAREAAAALGYLAHHRLVHRDVRAANCLVDARRSLKLADFGMARRLDEAGEAGRAGAGEYLCRRRALFPVLWMAPESLARGVFSAATDVWGLGVLMLELATLGARPFGAWPAPRVLRHVRAGGAPPLPRDAAPTTRGVAATCWRREAGERPTAAELVAYMAGNPRALRPALAPLEGDAGAASSPPGPDENIYFEEWTT